MPCCGQKRNSLKAQMQTPRPAFRTNLVSLSPRVATPSGRTVLLRYKETSRIIVQGAATRRAYEFSASQPVQLVDAQDAAALLSSRFFVRA